MKKRQYDAKGFRQRFGREETIRICLLAGTTYTYFKHIMAGRSRPSVDLARRLVRASDNRLGFELLLPDKPKKVCNLLPQYRANASTKQAI